MVFVFAVIIPIIVSGCYLLKAFLKDRKNKKIDEEWFRLFLSKELVDFGAAAVLALFAAFFSLQYESYNNQNIIVAFVFVSLVARFPVDLASTKKGESWKTWLIKSIKAVVALTGFFLELALFSKGEATYLLSGFRIGTFVLLAFAIGKIERLFDEDNEDKRLTFIRIACLTLFCGFLIITFFQPDKFYDGYPFRSDLEYITDVNPYLYYNVFDAFQHGQLHLLVEPNPALADLVNPYDYSARGGISYLWDTVYYNGHYYSYFGVAPVFLVMYPVYILSGLSYVPNGLFLLATAICLYGYGMFRLAKALSDRYNAKLPAWFFYSFVLLAIISSLGLSFLPKVWTDWKYRVPFAYANVGVVFFLYAFFEGLRNEKKRTPYWILSSAAFVAIMGSRPEVGLVSLLVVPFLVCYIRDNIRFNKRENWKPLVVFASVLVFGGILLASYNYLRFGSVLEFGANYQLTIMDTRENHLNAEGLVNGVYHYFLQLPTLTGSFPRFELSYVKLSNETHPYVLRMMGLIMNPFFYAVLFAPFAFVREKKASEWLFLMLPPFLLVMFAWILYCLGGVCTRYALYLWPIATISTMSIVLSATPVIAKKKYHEYAFYALILILLLLGTFTAMNFLYNSFDGLPRTWLE